MADPFTGEIRAFGFNYPPMDWAFCNGGHIPTSQNQALYSILGNLYDPNPPANTFGLPNLTDRAPIHPGTGNDGINPPQTVPLGAATGVDTVSLNLGNLPSHNHPFKVAGGNVASQATQGPAQTPPLSLAYHPMTTQGTTVAPYKAWSTKVAADTTLSSNTVQMNGAGTPHQNLQPYLALNFCICLYGDYPQHP